MNLIVSWISAIVVISLYDSTSFTHQFISFTLTEPHPKIPFFSILARFSSNYFFHTRRISKYRVKMSAWRAAGLNYIRVSQIAAKCVSFVSAFCPSHPRLPFSCFIAFLCSKLWNCWWIFLNLQVRDSLKQDFKVDAAKRSEFTAKMAKWTGGQATPIAASPAAQA